MEAAAAAVLAAAAPHASRSARSAVSRSAAGALRAQCTSVPAASASSVSSLWRVNWPVRVGGGCRRHVGGSQQAGDRRSVRASCPTAARDRSPAATAVTRPLPSPWPNALPPT